jgi:hypothetical protein
MKGLSAVVLGLAMSVVLAGCSDTADLQAESVAQWKAYCASRGKQFLWKDTAVSQAPLMMHAQAEGKCVGPGDRGYVAPEPAEDQP